MGRRGLNLGNMQEISDEKNMGAGHIFTPACSEEARNDEIFSALSWTSSVSFSTVCGSACVLKCPGIT